MASLLACGDSGVRLWRCNAEAERSSESFHSCTLDHCSDDAMRRPGGVTVEESPTVTPRNWHHMRYQSSSTPAEPAVRPAYFLPEALCPTTGTVFSTELMNMSTEKSLVKRAS